MASSVIAGSVSAVLQTNHVVGTIVTAGVYVAKVDLGSLQNGDEVELRFADVCSFSGTLSVAYSASYAHVQGTQIKVSPPVVVTRSAQFMIKQVAGVGRIFNFDVVSI